MTEIKLGSLYSLKNHPFEYNKTDIKISGLANMTPPILVVSEIMNISKEYDTSTGEEKSKQIKCVFYSHKSHKFEYCWANVEQLKILQSTDNTLEYLKSSSLEKIKKDFLNKQVILNSCDFELGKLKNTFTKTDSKSSQNTTSHLDYLPPVLTVIDVKINDDKKNYNQKTGKINKINAYFLLKCKWYNPISSNFSEDFIPINVVKLIENYSLEKISNLILKEKLIRIELKQSINLDLEEKSLTHTYIQPIELLFNHYKHRLIYIDFFTNKQLTVDLFHIDLNTKEIELQDIILKKTPEYITKEQVFSSIKDIIFKKNTYYRIIYNDLNDRKTRRVIYVKDFIPNKVIIANCLLRDGKERHFRLKEGSVLMVEELNQDYFKKLKEETIKEH